MEHHTVAQGECIFSLAARYNVRWDRIWSHAENRELARKRGTPSVLQPGDVLLIPDRETRSAEAATGQRHVFRYARPKVEIRLTIHDFDEPRANEPYYVMIGNERYDGVSPTTDENGSLVCEVPADTEAATLVLGELENEEWDLLLGHIDPIDSASGKNARLANLGFHSGLAEHEFDEESIQAMNELLAAQIDAGCRIIEENDANRTEHLKALVDAYGS